MLCLEALIPSYHFRCGRFMEALLPFLINLIQSSAKIMSSSAIVAIRFIIQHTHFHRLIPTITYNLSSKAKEIRKTCCEFLDQMLHVSTHDFHSGSLYNFFNSQSVISKCCESSQLRFI